MSTYDHASIEKKWQDRWKESGAFTADDSSSAEKKYILDMFPYPSGAGLHVGHVEGYTATDIYSRFLRMKGYNVLHPMGWDSFGLPAENYAIKTGVHPKITTEEAIKTFTAQIDRLGLSYDWARELAAHRPDYYRWTQWFFLLLYKNGLAYKQKAKVNWCPKDQTVLANEQVVDGRCERCGTEVIQKDLEQWFFRITKYAEELLSDLDTIDWPESTKAAQRNWIGKSQGSEIDFAIKDSDEKIRVFTTRPDTLFGATYMVLAPEHPLVQKLKDKLSNADEVDAYVAATLKRTELERTSDTKNKTGVELKGIKAINPANKEEIPVYLADYVLSHYGTGAIMAVPAHDERDFEFAVKFNIPIKQVVARRYYQTTEPGTYRPNEPTHEKHGVIVAIKHWSQDKYMALKWKEVAWGTFLTGGVDEGHTPEETVIKEIHEETGFLNPKIVRKLGVVDGIFYHVPKAKNQHVHGHVFEVQLENDAREEIAADEAAKHEILWLTKEELKSFLTPDTHQYSLRVLTEGYAPITESGSLIESGEFSGMNSEEAKEKITAFVGGEMKTTYRLRDWLISRQRYWGAPIPVIYCQKDGAQPVPETELPVTLPDDVDFMPTGESPLTRSPSFQSVTCPTCGGPARRESDTMDTFVCSSWYYFRFADPKNGTEFASKDALKKWLPVDLYMGGAEHTVLHLLYARFFTKVLRDLGYISFSEPFLKLRHQGTILAEDGRKMSKSLGNVINPDVVMQEFGADSLRLYEMFMGPLDVAKPWNTKNILGVRRFLEKVWNLSDRVSDEPLSKETDTLLNRTIEKVGGDIEAMHFNTAISQLMILTNHLTELERVPRSAYETLLRLLSPLAPHIAHELWEMRGNETSISGAGWPAFDPAKTVSDAVVIGVQVNGKVRGTVTLKTDTEETAALDAARKEPSVAKWLAGREEKAVYVPGRIISFVVKADG
jgi:leucyl-tRNA synthetase